MYWSEPWQSIFSVFNSAPLYASLLLVALLTRLPWLAGLALAALLHLAFDFPFHHDDAHSHFWPVSSWRFHSPLSYWDARHYGQLVAAFEILLALSLIGLLWRRFVSRAVRGALLAALATYIAVPLYFTLMLGG